MSTPGTEIHGPNAVIQRRFAVRGLVAIRTGLIAARYGLCHRSEAP